MLNCRRDRQRPKAYESSLLSRLLSVLVGSSVNLHCRGGTNVTGIVESCGGDLKSVPLGTAIAELEHCQRTWQHELTESQRASIEAVSKVKLPHGTSRELKVVSEPSRIYILRDCTVCFKGRTFSVEKLAIRQEYISTLVGDKNNVAKTCKKKFSSAQHLKRAILQAHRDLVKNNAFDQCARIGNNNNNNHD